MALYLRPRAPTRSSSSTPSGRAKPHLQHPEQAQYVYFLFVIPAKAGIQESFVLVLRIRSIMKARLALFVWGIRIKVQCKAKG